MKLNKLNKELQHIGEVLPTNETDYLLKKGFYKITFKDEYNEYSNFIILNFKEDLWTSNLDEFILITYDERNYSIKRLDYILDTKEIEEEKENK